MKDTATVLREAADLIDERGWRHGSDNRACGECVATALNSVTSTHGDFMVVIGVLAAHLDIPIARHGEPLGFGGVYDWNGAPGRTKEEVTSALRAAAEAVAS